MKISNVMMALLAGMAAGAALGILFAPGKGTETRDQLSASLTRLGDTVKTTATAQIDKMTERFRNKEAAEEQLDDLEHA